MFLIGSAKALGVLAVPDRFTAEYVNTGDAAAHNLSLIHISIAFSKPILYGLEHFVFGCAKSGMEAKDILIDNRQKLSDRIIIASDVSQGIVPMDPTERAFREMMGRTMLYLAAEADQVYRVFCGLGQQIK